MSNKYCIGNGNWSDTSIWSLSSGGIGGAAVPTSSDDVIIDHGSNVYIDTDIEVVSITITSSTNLYFGSNTIICDSIDLQNGLLHLEGSDVTCSDLSIYSAAGFNSDTSTVHINGTITYSGEIEFNNLIVADCNVSGDNNLLATSLVVNGTMTFPATSDGFYNFVENNGTIVFGSGTTNNIVSFVNNGTINLDGDTETLDDDKTLLLYDSIENNGSLSGGTVWFTLPEYALRNLDCNVMFHAADSGSITLSGEFHYRAITFINVSGNSSIHLGGSEFYVGKVGSLDISPTVSVYALSGNATIYDEDSEFHIFGWANNTVAFNTCNWVHSNGRMYFYCNDDFDNATVIYSEVENSIGDCYINGGLFVGPNITFDSLNINYGPVKLFNNDDYDLHTNSLNASTINSISGGGIEGKDITINADTINLLNQCGTYDGFTFNTNLIKISGKDGINRQVLKNCTFNSETSAVFSNVEVIGSTSEKKIYCYNSLDSTSDTNFIFRDNLTINAVKNGNRIEVSISHAVLPDVPVIVTIYGRKLYGNYVSLGNFFTTKAALKESYSVGYSSGLRYIYVEYKMLTGTYTSEPVLVQLGTRQGWLCNDNCDDRQEVESKYISGAYLPAITNCKVYPPKHINCNPTTIDTSDYKDARVRASNHLFPKLGSQLWACCNSLIEDDYQVLLDNIYYDLVTFNYFLLNSISSADLATLAEQDLVPANTFPGEGGYWRSQNPNQVQLIMISAMEKPSPNEPYSNNFPENLILKNINGDPMKVFGTGPWNLWLNYYKVDGLIDYIYSYYKANWEKHCDGIYWDYGAMRGWYGMNHNDLNPYRADMNDDGIDETDTDIEKVFSTNLAEFLQYFIKHSSDDKLFMGNGGGGASLSYRYILDGVMLETFLISQYSSWSVQMGQILYNSRNKPNLNLMMIPADEPFDAQFARYALCSALMTDGYFVNTNNAHKESRWADEYAVFEGVSERSLRAKGYLGNPLGDMYQATDDEISFFDVDEPNDYVWRRDFDNGIVLVNPTNGSVNITLETNYNKIQGIYETDFNDGSTVSSITLTSKSGCVLLRI